MRAEAIDPQISMNTNLALKVHVSNYCCKKTRKKEKKEKRKKEKIL